MDKSRAPILIVAMHRDAPNAHSTIASMVLADPRAASHDIVVCVDSVERGSFGTYDHLGPQVTVRTLSEDEAPIVQHLTPQARAARAYARALREGMARASASSGLIVLEDDVVFARGWLDAVDTTQATPLLGYDRFEGPLAATHPAGQPLWGALFLWWPLALAPFVARMLEETTDPCDEAIGAWCRDQGVPIRMARIVQHMGGASSINAAHGPLEKRQSPGWSPGLQLAAGAPATLAGSHEGGAPQSVTNDLSRVFLKVSQLEEEHALFKRAAGEVGTSGGAEALAKLVADNQVLRRELERYGRRTAYERWFGKTFGVDRPVPNTWPFTTFPVGTPWCDKVAGGMQDGAFLFAEHLLKKLSDDGVEGAVVELGTYFGHWLGLYATILEKHGWSRDLWGFDSFEGLPEPRPDVDAGGWTKGMYAAPVELVAQRLELDRRPRMQLVKGWFKDSLFVEPALSIDKIAFAHVDADLYESCVDCLKFLEGRLVDGAILVLADWQLSCDVGESRAFKEWVDKGVPYRFEFLAFNLWANLFVRVHKV
jgi:hypothetical protein